MGKTANDWSALKRIITTKDNAIDSLTQQLSAAQTGAADLQKSLDAANVEISNLRAQFDTADQAALAEMAKVVADNPIDPPAAQPAAPKQAAPAVQPAHAAQAAPKVAAAPAASGAPAASFAKPAAAPSMTTFTK